MKTLEYQLSQLETNESKTLAEHRLQNKNTFCALFFKISDRNFKSEQN